MEKKATHLPGATFSTEPCLWEEKKSTFCTRNHGNLRLAATNGQRLIARQSSVATDCFWRKMDIGVTIKSIKDPSSTFCRSLSLKKRGNHVD